MGRGLRGNASRPVSAFAIALATKSQTDADHRGYRVMYPEASSVPSADIEYL